jgi:D-glycero-D-manno-heptose 1,7-bisphosphate phosphatase
MSEPAAPRPLILDRDGTIVIDRHYLDDPEQLAFLPGAAQALQAFTRNGHRIIVITNQSGVARGRFTLERMHEVNERFVQMVAEVGGKIDAIYSCPHDPAAGCACRKPQPGLALEAARQFNFDPASSVVIGDKSTDVELGRRLGATTMLISSNGRAKDDEWVEPDHIIRDLSVAVPIVAQLGPVRSLLK